MEEQQRVGEIGKSSILEGQKIWIKIVPLHTSTWKDYYIFLKMIVNDHIFMIIIFHYSIIDE